MWLIINGVMPFMGVANGGGWVWLVDILYCVGVVIINGCGYIIHSNQNKK